MKFKEFLKSKHITKAALSRGTNISAQLIYRWEKGDCTPNPQCILKLSKFLECSSDEILQCFLKEE